jgi:multidrug resistance protein
MMIAGFSDGAGRRPAYNFCFIIYIAANIGLALQRNYAALLVLRCVQSAGSSGTVALCNGVVADMISSAERGVYIAYTSVPAVIGPIIGPILGGLIAQYLGWWWIFWILTIWSGATFILLLLFLPETCRKVVGDGSIPPPKLNQSLTGIIRERNRAKAGIAVDAAQQADVRKNYHLSFPNPLSTLVIATDKEGALILFCGGLIVALLYATTTGIPSQFGKIYGFNELQLGLVYIPFGSGSLISAFTTGKLVDWNYRKHAKRIGFPQTKNRYQDLTNFPIERARLEVALPMLYISVLGMIGYGWVLDYRTSLAGPLIFIFVFGYGSMAAFQVLQILMIDIYPGNAAAATAANNIFRCLLGAGSTAVVVPMINRLGVGWTYTFASLTWLTFSPLLWALMWYGPRWRKVKKVKKDEKEKADAQKIGIVVEEAKETARPADIPQGNLSEDVDEAGKEAVVAPAETQQPHKEEAASARNIHR